MCAELRIGDSIVNLSDAFPDMNSLAPARIGGSPVSPYLYVENADDVFNKAISSGSEPIMAMTDAFWGDRYGQLKDPYGHIWSVATHQKDASPEEIQRAAKQAFSKHVE